MARKSASNARPRPTRLASATGNISADASLAQARKAAPYFKKLLADMPMHGGMDSVREADHHGHHIAVRTTYEVTIDGKPLAAGLSVTDGGNVHYHGMPNVGFASAIDLVKAVIDTFPDEFAKGAGGHEDGGHEHGDHGGMDMGVASMPPMKSMKKKGRMRAVKRPPAMRRR